jgi:hypothetical protein
MRPEAPRRAWRVLGKLTSRVTAFHSSIDAISPLSFSRNAL